MPKPEKRKDRRESCCTVDGCSINKRDYPNITIFNLPKEEEMKKLWLTYLHFDKVPRNIRVCENHFEDSCFNFSVDLKNRLMNSKSNYSVSKNMFRVRNKHMCWMCVKSAWKVKIQLAFVFSESTMEAPEQCLKFVKI